MLFSSPPTPDLIPGREIAGVWFSGPFLPQEIPTNFVGLPGVYVIAASTNQGFYWLDVGQTLDFSDRFRAHPRWLLWELKSLGWPVNVFIHIENSMHDRRTKEWHLWHELDNLGYELASVRP